jgi:hypothetical protein
VEFLEYESVAAVFRAQGVVEHATDDRIAYSIEDEHDAIRRVVIGAPVDDAAARVVEMPRDKLGHAADAIANRLHFSEVGLIPAATWRSILDVAAFDLASDEMWLDIDAEAAMHQTGRDPLLLIPSDRPLIKTIIDALMAHGDAPPHDLHIIALEAPFVMSVSHEGRLNVWCANDAVADLIISVL